MRGDSVPATPCEPPDNPNPQQPTETDQPPSLADLCRRRDELGAEIDAHLNRLGRE
jgi:hypothetical protein